MLWVVVFALVTTPALLWTLRVNQPLAAGLQDPPAAAAAAHPHEGLPAAGDYVDISDVPASKDPARGPNASTGSYRHECGNNENGHYNPDNFIIAPGQRVAAHHMHDYVGNVKVDYRTTDKSLAASKDTTCKFGDQSAYFWPVLRDITEVGEDTKLAGGGKDGNHGAILPLADVRVQLLGNARAKVVAMPRFLRLFTGDAKALTNGPKNAQAQWTCAGFTNRITTRYPLCPDGAVQRVLEFPSCWDGENTDSKDHRTHAVFPGKDGGCPDGTQAIPRLRITLSYSAIPPGATYALDSFPEERHNPVTDHAGFANVMPADLMALIVDCINDGRAC